MAGWHPNTLILKPNTPTFALQKLLPRLPVPDLDDTLECLLETSAPLLTPEELKTSKAVIEEFRKPGGEGQQLHAKLVARAKECAGRSWDSNESQHWLEEWWDTVAYLMDRRPLPVNVNVFGTLNYEVAAKDPLAFAAQLIAGGLNVSIALDKETLQPDCLGKKGQLPLCMHQFKRTFATTRIAKAPMDELQVYPGSRHVIVAIDDQYYTFDGIREDGSALSVADVLVQVQRIWSHANATRTASAKEPAMGTLTYDDRDAWAEAREHLLTNKTNSRSLLTIERALFVMQLSRESPATSDEMMMLLSVANGRALWNDKSFNLVVFANGKVGFNGEHSASDAPVPQRIVTEITTWARAHEKELNDKPNVAELMKPRKLDWEVDATVTAALEHATATAKDVLSNHQLKTIHFKRFGKYGPIKMASMAPDSFMQVALQLAHWRDLGRVAATYESATMRTFLHGRTETIRGLTPESFEFVKAMDNPKVSLEDKFELFKTAGQAHLVFLQRCMRGHGIDRHLLGMRILSYQTGLTPKLFADPVYVKSSHWTLSTSQMAFKTLDWPGFGAPAEDAYGCCYVCGLKGEMVATVTSNGKCKEKNAARFAAQLEKAMHDLGDLMQSQGTPMSKL